MLKRRKQSKTSCSSWHSTCVVCKVISTHSKPETHQGRLIQTHSLPNGRNIQGQHPSSSIWQNPKWDVATIHISHLQPPPNSEPYHKAKPSEQWQLPVRLIWTPSCDIPAEQGNATTKWLVTGLLVLPKIALLFSMCKQRKFEESFMFTLSININARNRRTKEVTRGFAAKLWNKVKQRLLRSNNMQSK